MVGWLGDGVFRWSALPLGGTVCRDDTKILCSPHHQNGSWFFMPCLCLIFDSCLAARVVNFSPLWFLYILLLRRLLSRYKCKQSESRVPGLCLSANGALIHYAGPLPGFLFRRILKKANLHRASLVAQAGKDSACNTGDVSLIPGSGRSPWRRK